MNMAHFYAKKLANVFTFVFLFLSLGFANQANAFAVKGKIERPYLYALEKDGSVSFVFGTAHLPLEPDQYPSYLMNALKSQPIFLNERDVSKAFGIRKTETKNSEQIIRGFEARGIPRKFVEYTSMKQLCPMYTEWDFVTNGNQFKLMDGYLQAVAQNSGKQIFELDVDKKLTLKALSEVKKCDEAKVLDLINYSASDINRFMQSRYQIGFNKYRTGYIEFATDKEQFQTTVDRNQLWVNELLKYHSQGFFAAGGVNHLAPNNKNGLIALLKKNGFKITRISSELEYAKIAEKYCLN